MSVHRYEIPGAKEACNRLAISNCFSDLLSMYSSSRVESNRKGYYRSRKQITDCPVHLGVRFCRNLRRQDRRVVPNVLRCSARPRISTVRTRCGSGGDLVATLGASNERHIVGVVVCNVNKIKDLTLWPAVARCWPWWKALAGLHGPRARIGSVGHKPYEAHQRLGS